jgi:hypothetical protein
MNETFIHAQPTIARCDEEDRWLDTGPTRGTATVSYSSVMALPPHWQPSSDGSILTWLTALTVLTAGAICVRRMRSPRARP